MKTYFIACAIIGLAVNLQAAEPVLQLDAGTIAHQTSNNSSVTEWKSSNGTVRLMQANAANAPILGTKLGGRSTLYFDGNDYLKGPAVLPEGDTTFTIVALWRPHRVGVQAIFEQASPGTGRRASLLQVRNAYGFNGQANDFHSAVPLQANKWRLSTIVVNGAERDNVCVIDNAAEPVTGTIDIDQQDVGIDGIIIGRKFTVDGEYLHGDIAALRIFDKILPRDDLLEHLTDIKSTWGLDFESIIPEFAPAEDNAQQNAGINTQPTAAEAEFFESKVRPLLVQRCFECHSGESNPLQAGLRLDAPHWINKGGDSGTLLVPGKPNESLFIESVRYESYEMPPREQLADSDINILVKWVELGAPWPASASQLMDVPADEEPYDWDKFRNEHWAFRPVEMPQPPTVINESWPQQPFDNFVLAKLEANELAPNTTATKRTLLRRAYLDLIGLPPTPSQVDTFLSDNNSDAFETVIDELLASPHYGERWARHWLDVARYSDGLGGFLDSADLPMAWHYRDWVVKAFNDDMPYDEFVRRQIAGDVLHGIDDPVATGFFAVGPTYKSDGGDPKAKAQAKAETLADRIDTFSRAFLGLTAACARCHDHKFDPITIEDYYALAGVFNNSNLGEYPLASAEQVQIWRKATAAVQSQRQIVNKFLNTEAKRLKTSRKQVEKRLNDQQRSNLQLQRHKLQQLEKSVPPKFDIAHVLTESGTANMHVALRGDLQKKGDEVPRRFPEIFTGKEFTLFSDGSGRRQLAQAVTDPKNPITARVIVNRIWQWHFGEGLVRTPGNFGILGEKPTHPQMLDWLVSRFIYNDWSIKQLHREIMLSSTWQMASTHHESKFAVDGDNRLLWQMSPRKLDVEVWRDSLLAVTGELDQTVGGTPTEDILNSNRRSLYAKISRSGDKFDSDAFFRLFDFPAAQATAPKRVTTTVPQQYLFMMNHPFMMQRAIALTQILKHLDNNNARIQQAYLRLYSRPASESELRIGLAFLNNDDNNWPKYAQVLLSAHEFIQTR